VVGGPFVGWVCQRWSPRTGFALAGTATLATALALTAWSRSTRRVEVTAVAAPAVVDVA
jgi:hypothetical protein